MCDELTKGEEKLKQLSKEFLSFLESEPKIRFNLHVNLHTIKDDFRFILSKL